MERKRNFYCNILCGQDCFGPSEREEQRFAGLLGKEDGLITVSEHFGLRVIEKRADREVLKEGFHGVDIIITENVTHYKRRKGKGALTGAIPIWYSPRSGRTPIRFTML